MGTTMAAISERFESREEALATIKIFQDLSPDEVRAIARCCQWRRFQAHQTIVEYQDETDDVFFIVSGKVRVTFYSASGREVTFRDLSAGQIFGELSAIDGSPRSASVVAVTDTVLATMTVAAFWDILRRDERVAAATFRWLVCLVRSLSERVIEFSTLCVQRRIRVELLRLARKTTPRGNTAVIAPVPTHADFANRISTHREAVTRELSHLARAGLIEKCGNALIIRNISVLAATVEDADPD